MQNWSLNKVCQNYFLIRSLVKVLWRSIRFWLVKIRKKSLSGIRTLDSWFTSQNSIDHKIKLKLNLNKSKNDFDKLCSMTNFESKYDWKHRKNSVGFEPSINKFTSGKNSSHPIVPLWKWERWRGALHLQTKVVKMALTLLAKLSDFHLFGL